MSDPTVTTPGPRPAEDSVAELIERYAVVVELLVLARQERLKVNERIAELVAEEALTSRYVRLDKGRPKKTK